MTYGKLTPELIKLSAKVSELQAGLESHFNISGCFIGAGSSRTILDHYYYGKPLKMRDLDIFVTCDHEVTKGFAQKVGETLQSLTLGEFKPNELRRRPRAKEISNETDQKSYNAGYGFFWINDHEDIVDLSMFHSMQDMRLNGLLDIDRIILPLSKGENLCSFLDQKVSPIAPDQLSSSGQIDDLFDGYSAWINGTAKFVNQNELARDPIIAAIRSTRAYAKIDKDLPDEFVQRVKAQIEISHNRDEFQWIRNVGKLLEDEDPIRELKNIDRAGVISKFSPAYRQKLIDLMKVRKGRGRSIINDSRHFFAAAENSMKRAVTMGA